MASVTHEIREDKIIKSLQIKSLPIGDYGVNTMINLIYLLYVDRLYTSVSKYEQEISNDFKFGIYNLVGVFVSCISLASRNRKCIPPD